MKASQLMQHYEQGRRNFRGQDLRGQSFQGQNLVNADFSEADIRGTNFSKTNLTGAKFCQARGGLTKQREIVLRIISLSLAMLSGIFSGLASSLILLIFDGPHIINQIVGWTALTILLIFCIFSYSQGLIGGIGAATLSFMTTLVIALIIAQAFPVLPGNTLFLVAIFISHVAFVLAGTLAGALAGATIRATIGAIIGLGAFPWPIILYLTFAQIEPKTLPFAGVLGIGLVLTLLSVYFGLRSIKGDDRDILIRRLAFAFAAMGGTSFYQSNLTNADLTEAILKATDLRQANLTRTRFYQSQQLHQARLEDTILAQPEVRDLLIDPKTGYKKYYYKANLRGANLDYGNLNGANLKQADLREATLQNADLEETNLTKVLALGTDFTGASLHGACIEDWKIDVSTKLNNVDCEYIFLLEKPNEYGSRERCPYDPVAGFEPGDFEMLYKVRNYVKSKPE
ncbi:MAG TPA: hypothetical protein DCF68_06500 [Cyanothece sp. UBA12306]|nr:hypothetical protein [Cyanothece sp. UBA12306]